MEIAFLQELSCSKSNVDQHFVKEPIGLDCGHCICKSCSTTLRIKCNKCGEINERDLRDTKELIAIKQMIKMCLPSLLNEIEKQTTESVERLKSLLETGNESIEVQIKYVEEEIEIKIESMKIELDEIHEKFKTNVASLRKAIEERQRANMNSNELKIEDYETSLNELRSYLKKSDAKNEETIYHHQDNLRKLKEAIKSYETLSEDLQLHFEPSNYRLDEKLVGDVSFKKLKLDINKMKEIIETMDYEVKSLGFRSFDSCVLPNNNNYVFSNDNGTLTVYDGKFKLLNTIEKIDNKKLYPLCMALDNKTSKLYISDHSNQVVIMLDVNFNYIKSYGIPGNQKFMNPYDICFHNELLYVCDHTNSQIQILSGDLNHIDNIKLTCNPYIAKVSNTTLCVCGNSGTYFYNINSKQLKAQYPGVIGRISEMNSNFYLFSYKPKKTLYVYDTEGVLIEEINIDRFANNITTFWDGHFTLLKDHLIITSYYEGQILDFKINKNK